jgi:hypothetical protein
LNWKRRIYYSKKNCWKKTNVKRKKNCWNCWEKRKNYCRPEYNNNSDSLQSSCPNPDNPPPTNDTRALSRG